MLRLPTPAAGKVRTASAEHISAFYGLGKLAGDSRSPGTVDYRMSGRDRTADRLPTTTIQQPWSSASYTTSAVPSRRQPRT